VAREGEQVPHRTQLNIMFIIGARQSGRVGARAPSLSRLRQDADFAVIMSASMSDDLVYGMKLRRPAGSRWSQRHRVVQHHDTAAKLDA